MRITLELHFVQRKNRDLYCVQPSEVSWFFSEEARTHKSNFISRILFDLKDGGRVWQLVRDLIVVILHTSVIYLLLIIISDCCRSFPCSCKFVTLSSLKTHAATKPATTTISEIFWRWSARVLEYGGPCHSLMVVCHQPQHLHRVSQKLFLSSGCPKNSAFWYISTES